MESFSNGKKEFQEGNRLKSDQSRIALILQLLAPYIAVGIFWCGRSNAWLAILVYHVQIVLWGSREGRPAMSAGSRGRQAILLALLCALCGPLVYCLLPWITRIDLGQWLESHQLSGSSLLIMIPYFGLVHPLLEQRHWAGLRARTAWAHPAFAGYHMLVLQSLLPVPWLLVSAVVLLAASILWEVAQRTTGNLAAPILSHILADLGIVLAAWARTQG
ncbi:MAG TPA: hypothetical protein DEW46_13030 [Verrucomicrobia bacterium]|jgi:hypothetical protein|nr:hypothetical protein [Verrucomicrobiota bacterium]